MIMLPCGTVLKYGSICYSRMAHIRKSSVSSNKDSSGSHVFNPKQQPGVISDIEVFVPELLVQSLLLLLSSEWAMLVFQSIITMFLSENSQIKI
jgi:hypothetical protein